MKRVFAYGLLGLALLIIAGSIAFAVFQPVKVLPRMRLAPGFLLTAQDGQKLNNEDLRGSIVLYSFTFTRCGDACAQTDQTMRLVQDRLGELEASQVPIVLLTISVDPQTDTPAVLADHAAAMGALPGVWRFATTTDETLLKTIVGGGFEVYYGTNPAGSLELDPAYVLVDGWGIIRGEYRYQTQTPDAERILRHIDVLLEEVRKSVGPARLVYEAAHLFLCYAP